MSLKRLWRHSSSSQIASTPYNSEPQDSDLKKYPSTIALSKRFWRHRARQRCDSAPERDGTTPTLGLSRKGNVVSAKGKDWEWLQLKSWDEAHQPVARPVVRPTLAPIRTAGLLPDDSEEPEVLSEESIDDFCTCGTASSTGFEPREDGGWPLRRGSTKSSSACSTTTSTSCSARGA